MIDSQEELKSKLIHYTNEWIQFANRKLNKTIPPPKVEFKVRGTTAGWANSTEWHINYNLGLAKDNFIDFMDQTVPHEVAHLVADYYFCKKCKHGKEWKQIMKLFGKTPTRCHNYEVSHHRVRRTFRHIYKCGCDSNCVVGTKHHNIIQAGESRISCRRCRVKLKIGDFIERIAV